jgi:hypothetical protein
LPLPSAMPSPASRTFNSGRRTCKNKKERRFSRRLL